MLTNLLKDRVLVVDKTATQGALGATVYKSPNHYHYALVRPLSVQARASFQQLDSLVTHEVLFRDEVTISLGQHQIKHGSKTYEPVEPPKLIEHITVVAVKEI
jgi:hypothetical protein